MKRNKIKTLPLTERERRWRQHVATRNSRRKQPATKVIQRSMSNPRRAPDEGQICALHFAQSLLNPFETPPVCAPWFPALTSGKYKAFFRGQLATGTQGFGFISCLPGAASDQTNTWYSDSAYTGTSITNFGTGVNTGSPNSPFLSADISSQGVEVRFVSCGIRVRYTGTELNKGGTIRCLEEPDHQTLEAHGMNDLASYDQARAVPVDKDWVAVTFQHIRAEEFQYLSTPNLQSPGVPIMGIGIQTPVAGSTFDFEMTTNFEAIGANVRNKTSSHADIGLTTKIVTAASKLGTKAYDMISRNPAAAAQIALNLVTKIKPMLNWSGAAKLALPAVTQGLALTM